MDAAPGPFSQDKLEASFAEFTRRPENAGLVERAQREEVANKLKADEKLRWLHFKEQAEAAGIEAVQALGPFLHHPVLRRLVMSFGNDAEGGVAAWACNPRVQALLSRAKQLLEGGMEGKELEHLMLQHLKAPSNPSSHEFREKAQAVATLPTELLVGALNEHLAERNKGARLLAAGRPTEALTALERALAIVNVVRGQHAADQEEVEANQAATHRALAAALLALQQCGLAAQHCTHALALRPHDAEAHVLRARARVVRREFQDAEADLRAACSLDPELEGQAAEVRATARGLAAQDKSRDAQLCRRMFAPR